MVAKKKSKNITVTEAQKFFAEHMRKLEQFHKNPYGQTYETIQINDIVEEVIKNRLISKPPVTKSAQTSINYWQHLHRMVMALVGTTNPREIVTTPCPILITPSMARDLFLYNNTLNRPIIKPNYKKMMNDMGAGKFLELGHVLRFDWNYLSLDHQHIQISITGHGQPYPMNVQFGHDPKNFWNIDKRRYPKTVADNLAVKIPKCTPYRKILATATDRWFKFTDRISNVRSNKSVLEADESYALIQKHPWVLDICEKAKLAIPHIKGVVSAALFATAWVIIRSKSKVKRKITMAKEFFYCLRYRTDPIHNNPLPQHHPVMMFVELFSSKQHYPGHTARVFEKFIQRLNKIPAIKRTPDEKAMLEFCTKIHRDCHFEFYFVLFNLLKTWNAYVKYMSGTSISPADVIWVKSQPVPTIL